ncbi:hypothetical protein CEP52_011322 [Fusarium oligoseptatum]|uniref:Uncharacterized protein n=1 Tax=Fusarium oligoseptatum TaxID=2604345 RepID=A0A428T3R1_9HYPO|nr:hypothetical protein CEP52_011322 [Fusarium oligoseptatum]
MAKPRVSGETKRKSRGRIGGVFGGTGQAGGGAGRRGRKGREGNGGREEKAEVATKVRDNGQAGLGQVSKDDG